MQTNRNTRNFVLFTYATTWLLWLPAIVQSLSGKEISPLWFVVGVLGLVVPSVMGLFFLKKENKWKEVWRALFHLRLNTWMLLTLVLLPFVMVAAHTMNVLFFGGAKPVIAEPHRIPLQFLSVLLIGGPLIEEIGWRGYLQTKLNERFPVLVAGLMVGAIWSVWHFPLFLIKEMLHGGMPLAQFAITAVLMSVVMGFFMERGKSGIWPPLIFHTYMNVTMDVTPLFNEQGHLLWSIVNGILAALVAALVLLEIRAASAKKGGDGLQNGG